MNEDYEKGLRSLETLRDWYANNEANRNEATTRSHLIDNLIYGALGWDRQNVTLEEQKQGEYADYTLHAPRPLLIVEAKREGTYFEIPSQRANHVRKLNPLIRSNDILAGAIGQVASYCQKRGVPYAAVSNGHQLICFLATRLDGIPPLEGRAISLRVLKRDGEKFFSFMGAPFPVWNCRKPLEKDLSWGNDSKSPPETRGIYQRLPRGSKTKRISNGPTNSQ